MKGDLEEPPKRQIYHVSSHALQWLGLESQASVFPKDD